MLRTLATEVFGDTEAVRLWLRTPLPALGNQTSIDLLGTRADFDRAQNALLRQTQGKY